MTSLSDLSEAGSATPVDGAGSRRSEAGHLIHPQDVLNLGRGVSLRLHGDSLIVKDKAITQRQRSAFCGVPFGSGPSEFRIPFYNVLWAEVVDDTITIDYGTVATKRIRPAKLSYPLGEVPDSEAKVWVESLMHNAYGPAQRRKRGKALVNPHAGPGGAVRIWEQDVEPLMKAARMVLDVEHTKAPGAAIDICAKLDIDRYDIVMPCSGDGLAYEVFNGLGMRPDARKALRQLAVAHVPCGSGNGMSCNLNGTHKPDRAALAIIKGVRTPMDLVSITQGDKRTLSFLSQSVGIIAASDLGTEHLRWMGPHRFDYGVVKGMITKMAVPMTVSVKTELVTKEEVKAAFAREKREQNRDDFAATREERGLREGTSSGSGDSTSSEVDAGEGLPPLKYGTVKDKIPSDWETAAHEKMGNFYCGNMAWMAPDVNFFPAASANDGLMDLVTSRANLSFLEYANILLSVESGKFFNLPSVSYTKVVAYRLTPHEDTGYISIDGESVPFEPFQAEVHQGLATVISKNGRYETPGPLGWESYPSA